MVKKVLYSEAIIERNSHLGSTLGSQITQNRRSPGIMKKYYQAVLLGVALLSLVSLLFYRHEYNRLRYVLEVLNFYGKPGAQDADINCTGRDSLEKLDHLFNSPLPSWQRLNDQLFVYSAHCVRKNEIRAIAFGTLNDDDMNMNCKVFFEGKAPALGTLKHYVIQEYSAFAGYQLICEYSGIGIPESVSFFAKESSSGEKALLVSVKNYPETLVGDEMALCIAPPMNRSISRTDMISFINFHQIIGVRNFIVYDYGIPSRFTETVRDIVISQGVNITVTILPWNFPFYEISEDIVKGIIETDCLYRTLNEVEFSVTLHWEEYVVLKFHNNLLELLKSFGKTVLNSVRYSLNTSVFCTQQKDDELSEAAVPIAFRKTNRVSPESVKTKNVYINKPHKSLNASSKDFTKTDTDLLNLNRYQYCVDAVDQVDYMWDKSILRFANAMFDAPIYKEFINRTASISK